MSSPVQAGDIVAGKYRVDSVLGRGGMGIVVAATDTILDRRVAVKFLLPQYATNEVAAGRFLREARATARLNSEHAVRIIEVGQLDTGSPFMAMEFLQGTDLGTYIEQHGALEVKQAVDYVLQASRGLAEAHRAGIIHRDVKPSNLFLAHQSSGKPVVKVLDFGVSKLNLGLEAGVGSLTTTGQTLGSPLYMAPEQMRSSQHVDARSDIWGLGVVLFELLTGARPFIAESLAELVLVINQEPPIDPRVLRPDLPDGLCRVVLRCLEKDPNRRYASVSEFADELAQFGNRDSRAAAREIRGIDTGVHIPGPAPVGTFGTMIVHPGDHAGLAELARMGESSLGPSSSSVDHTAGGPVAPGTATQGGAAGSMTSAPWASTRDGENQGPPKPATPNSSGIGWAIGLGLGSAALLLGGIGIFLLTREASSDDSAILSAASELSEAANHPPRANEGTVPEASAASGLEVVPSPATTTSAAAEASAATEPAPAESATRAGNPPPKRIPKRPEQPKSAKDRLGF